MKLVLFSTNFIPAFSPAVGTLRSGTSYCSSMKSQEK